LRATVAVEEYCLASSSKSPTLAALNTLAALMLCGLVPLVSYLFAREAFRVRLSRLVRPSSVSGQSRVAGHWQDDGDQGLETFVIGMGAASQLPAQGRDTKQHQGGIRDDERRS
jgi:hypothetical protein